MTHDDTRNSGGCSENPSDERQATGERNPAEGRHARHGPSAARSDEPRATRDDSHDPGHESQATGHGPCHEPRALGRINPRNAKCPAEYAFRYPPTSEIWPVLIRGERWNPEIAKCYEGKCQQCVFGFEQPPAQQRRNELSRWPRVLLCVNHPDSPGVLREVKPTEQCRNFQAKRDKPVRLEPPEPPEEGVRMIALTQGKFAIVSEEDYERVNQYRWCVCGKGRRAYACRSEGGKHIAMHRFIMDPPEGMVVDHRDGNGLDNRRSNLRVCTQKQNTHNSRPKGKSSRFKGVCYDKARGQWMAPVRSPDGKDIHTGRFDDEVEAAKAHDRLARELHGEFAYLNFPDAVEPDPAARDP